MMKNYEILIIDVYVFQKKCNADVDDGSTNLRYFNSSFLKICLLF